MTLASDLDPLLDDAPCGYLSFTDDGVVTAVNRTLLGLLDLPREEVEGQPLDRILTVGARIFYQTHFFPVLRLHGAAEEIYLTLRTRAGHEVPVLVNAVRRERAGATRNDCVLVRMLQRHRFEDELLHARREAEAANEAKSRFLSMISHELRTPLGTIGASAEILALGDHGPVTDLQLKDLRRINAATKDLRVLLDDILNYARQESGQVEISLQDVAAEDAMARAETMVAVRLGESGLDYERAAVEPGLLLRADPDRLQQILLNLLSNAIKFTPRGGLVSTRCEGAGRMVALHVRDTGRGIPANQLERIFEPFVQVERDQVAGDQRGVGLGLAISRQLARAMGGDLRARSTVGEGSELTLTLPRADDTRG